MTHGNTEAIVYGSVAGHSLQRMAADSGVSISTVQRRLRQPQVRQEIVELRMQHRQELLGVTNAATLLAVERIVECLEDENPFAVLQAANLLLSSATRLAVLTDIEERLVRLKGERDGVDSDTSETDPSSPDGNSEGSLRETA